MMDVVLHGDSPSALTAGILLLSRARSFGLVHLRVRIEGDPDAITPILGPALLHSTVLASCGVGRDLGQGPLVVVPGAPGEPLLVSLAKDGLGPWFELDTTGVGSHPATAAFVRLCRDSRPRARKLGKQLRRFLALLGIPAEPALLDLLFAAPAPPLDRLALTLRAGRTITGDAGMPVHGWLASEASEFPDPLPQDVPGEVVVERYRSGALESLLARTTVRGRDRVEDWLEGMVALGAGDGGRNMDLVGGLAELASHVALLPAQGMLPLPTAAADAVAMGLGRALGAHRGEHDASRALLEVFQFLGGRFVEGEEHPIRLGTSEAPVDRSGRWQWFVGGVNRAASRAEDLWREVIDRPS